MRERHTEGYRHSGERKEVEIDKLPSTWKFTDGLTFPLTLTKEDGAKLTFYDYKEYHYYIAQLFKKQQ